MNAGIYKLTSPSGKSYIGQSINLKSRLSQYKRLECQYQPKLQRAILKYGWDNFIVEILFETKIVYKHLNKLLDSIECYSIKKNDAINNGYNIRFGGTNGKMSEETKLKISKTLTGRIKTEEHLRNISKALKGNIPSKESTEKRKLTRKGYKPTEETKEKVRLKMKGYKPSQNTIDANIKAVLQYDTNGNFIKEWKSISEVNKMLHIDGSAICKVCRNKLKKTGGYVWKYK